MKKDKDCVSVPLARHGALFNLTEIGAYLGRTVAWRNLGAVERYGHFGLDVAVRKEQHKEISESSSIGSAGLLRFLEMGIWRSALK